MPAKGLKGIGTLGNLNRLLAEIFSAPKAEIEASEVRRIKRARPKRHSHSAEGRGDSKL